MRREIEIIADELRNRKAIFKKNDLNEYLFKYSCELLKNAKIDVSLAVNYRRQLAREHGEWLLKKVNSYYILFDKECIIKFPNDRDIAEQARREYMFGCP